MDCPGMKDLSVSKKIPELLKSRVMPFPFLSSMGNAPLYRFAWRFSDFFIIVPPAFDHDIAQQLRENYRKSGFVCQEILGRKTWSK
jgi:hypothetical protein